MYTKKNGYYKYYSKDGKVCRIKFDIPSCYFNSAEQVIISFRKPPKFDERLSHIPKRKFNNVFEVIRHIIKNLETDGLIFEVSNV